MYSVNGTQGASGNLRNAQQARERQQWINKFNTRARTAERKADERAVADAAGVVAGTAVGVATAPALGGWGGGFLGGAAGLAVTYTLDRAFAITDHQSH